MYGDIHDIDSNSLALSRSFYEKEYAMLNNLFPEFMCMVFTNSAKGQKWKYKWEYIQKPLTTKTTTTSSNKKIERIKTEYNQTHFMYVYIWTHSTSLRLLIFFGSIFFVKFCQFIVVAVAVYYLASFRLHFSVLISFFLQYRIIRNVCDSNGKRTSTLCCLCCILSFPSLFVYRKSVNQSTGECKVICKQTYTKC